MPASIGRFHFSILTAILVSITLVGCSSAPEPPPHPTLDSLSPAEAQTTIGEELDFYWLSVTGSFPDSVRPKVTIVRQVVPSEQPAAVAECMIGLGYEGTKAERDGVSFGVIPAGQASAHAIALYSCYASYPLDPQYNQPANESQIQYIYYYWTQTLTKCLETRGVTVSEPPSYVVFSEKFGQNGSWDPYASLDIINDPQRLTQVLDECPLYPSDYYG